MKFADISRRCVGCGKPASKSTDDGATLCLECFKAVPYRKNPAAVLLGSLGGKAGTGKAKARTKAQCRAAALKRWRKK